MTQDSSLSPASSKTRLLAILGLVFAVAAVILSGILACKQMGVCQFSTGCSFDGVDGCAELGKMAASHIPIIGLPIAYLGLFYYLFVGGLFLQLVLRKEGSSPLLSLLVFLAVFGSVFDLFLAYKNFVTLSPCREGTWFCPKCSLCAWTYLTQLGILIATVILYMKETKQNPETGSLPMLLGGLKSGWPSLASALVLALVTGLLIGTPGDDLAGPKEGGTEKKEAPRLSLPPLEQVDRIVRQLEKNTKKVKMDTTGLTSTEGPKNAVVTIHKFADFLCPHCLHASLMLRFLRERWPNRVRIYYRYLPLDGKCNFLAGGSNPQIADQRCDSAKAAWCAGKQSPEFFRHFYHGIFDFQNRNVPPELDALERLAERHGGNWSAIRACMKTEAQAGINRDLKVVESWIKSKAIESPATPILVLNGQLLGAGVPDFRSMVYWVDAMILQKDGKKAIADFTKLHPWAKKGETK